ncbi:LysR family transcriptional regulator [Shewanella livingstonensis]|uniref:LysR family transcriptional regulator n=1 Tax=Shewanella livingstonensis TaxID=150120 RepID=A0A3G8LSW3_9GAMM|nr:LysR family transcriptional regulator [Shewanella livingstonensis]AZG72295.1 LysR family transcriptional regulator [Shewanella livingstonensis]
MLHSKIDLNLFLVMTTVYQQGSITAAATKLHLTQPAVSHAIARLRDKFNDPLFVRHGRKMVPTALCQKIIPDVQQAMNLLNNSISNPAPFDIQQHKREIKLGLRDILESMFFPILVPDLLKNTPNLTVNSRQIKRTELEPALAQQNLDIVIDVLMPTHKDIRSSLICHEAFSLICRKDHPILQQLTLENYAKASHALVSLKDFAIDTVDMALATQGIARNIALRCEHYFAAINVVSQSDMIMTMPNSYAMLLQQSMPIVVSPLPFEVPDLAVHMYWHQQAQEDPVNQWIRDKLLTISAQLFTQNKNKQ